jgi:syntaxin-binding protein 5
VAGYSGHVILFKFRKQESVSETLVLEIPITYENTDEADVSPECEFIPRSLPKQPDSTENEKKVSAQFFFFSRGKTLEIANK